MEQMLTEIKMKWCDDMPLNIAVVQRVLPQTREQTADTIVYLTYLQFLGSSVFGPFDETGSCKVVSQLKEMQ